MTESPGMRSHRRLLFAALWVLSALLVAGAARAPNATVRVLDGRGETALEPNGTWTVPALSRPAIDAAAEWPYWMFVLAASSLLSFVGLGMLSRDVPSPVVFLAITSLGMTVRPEHFLLAIVLSLASFVLHREMRSSRKALALLACLVFGPFVSIEFGFVLIFIALIMLPEFWQYSSWRLFVGILGALVLFGGVLWANPGFSAMVLRPVNWIWLHRPDSIFSKELAAFPGGENARAQWLLLVFFLSAWVMVFWKPEHGRRPLALLLFLTVLGFGHPGYLWICGVALALVFSWPVRSEIFPRLGQAIFVVALAFGLLRFLPQGGAYLDLAFGESNPSRVEPANWGIKGRVMLLDLSQSADWQSAKSRERFSLLMDDRWEVFHGQYRHYAAVCRDLREVRADSYLRTDGGWGGYRHWLEEWSPTLLVASSEDLWDIRRLSLSPHWRVMGIDARRTIFGHAQDPENYSQSARMLGMMMQLEWPPLAAAAWPENVMAASTPEELLKVSRVLNALRFPYAALRLLPEEPTLAARLHLTWCRLEIAHRVYRHSGQGSLLDQFRAVHRMRRHLNESELSPEDALRVLASLEGLGLEGLTNQLAGDLCNSWSDSKLTEPLRERLKAIKSRTSGVRSSVARTDSSFANAEAQLRHALLEGDLSAARSHLEHLEGPVKDYYGLIIASLEMPLSELFGQWSALIQQPDFPQRLRGEALFYLGCLALELGNSEASVSAFRESEQAEPSSPFHALCRMYRRQMDDR